MYEKNVSYFAFIFVIVDTVAIIFWIFESLECKSLVVCLFAVLNHECE